MPQFHAMEITEALSEVSGSKDGLSSKEAAARLEKYGPNELKKESGISPLRIFAGQFTSFLIILLIIAAIISLAVGELVDGILILIIVVMNGIFGFVQEYKAEKNIEELKKLSQPKSVVLRDGRAITIASEEIVVGDVLVLEEGNSVAADARVIEAYNMRADESTLTGESMPVLKNAKKVTADTVLAERTDMVYKGSAISAGRGMAIVTATGMETELGDIAKGLQEIKKEQTPFQKQLDTLGKKIGLAIMAITVIVAVVGIASGEADLLTMALIAIALGVAAIPEGLPAVITLSLALGTKAMLKRNALVRRLPVAEGLGSVDVICTDKTGTLTENRMTVSRMYFGSSSYSVMGAGNGVDGEFKLGDKTVDPGCLKPLLEAGILNNDSRAAKGDSGYVGDPTEIALRVSAKKAGLSEDSLRDKVRFDEIAFSSERKMMTTLHKHEGKVIAYSKGAPEVILNICDRFYEDGKIKKLTKKKREDILKANKEFGSDALRVLGFAYRDMGKKKVDASKSKEIESNMVFLGLQGMIDPPRDGVKEAISDCLAGGIRVVMITGDNAHTAEAIAKEVGLTGRAIEGKDIEGLDENAMCKLVKEVSIFARVSPRHKLDILNALKKNGHIVAMTGDGVNDAPALKASDVGISMGLRGTDVAKETSDIILLDDNFATIRNSIEEGRRIFDNVRKFVNYLLSCNLAEVLVVFIAGLPFIAGEPLMVFSPVMLLWINISTDGLPALALGLDPAAKGILKRKPRPKGEGVINKAMATSILALGIAITIITLALFYISNPLEDLQRAQTIAFTALVMFELVRIQSIRATERLGMFSNKYLVGAMASSIALQLAVIYTPLNAYFKLVPLGIDGWVLVFVGLVVLSAFTAVYHKIASRELKMDIADCG